MDAFRLGSQRIGVVVLGGGRVSEERLERVDEVPAVGDPVLAHVVVDGRLGVRRRVEVARHVVVEHRHVARALHVRLAAQRVDAAAGLADVAEQELQDRERPDPLHAGRVLGHPERVEDGRRPVLRHRLRDLPDLLGRNAGDPLARLQRVPRDEGLQAREDAVRVIQALGDTRLALRVELVSPALGVVLVVLLVVPAEDAILEVERLVAQVEGVRVGDDVILVVQLVDEDVVDHRVLERRVGAGPDARVHVRRRRRSGCIADRRG